MDTSNSLTDPKNHENNFDVHAFADDQVDAHAKEQIFLKLTENPENYSEYLWIVKIKQTLQKYSKFHPHFMLWARIKQQMNTVDKEHQKKEWNQKLIWIVSGLLFFICILAGFYYRSTQENRLDARTLAKTNLHLAPIAAFHLSEQLATKEWINQLLGKPLLEILAQNKEQESL